jgi:hypothetical protein
LALIENTGSVKSEFWTEETAVEEDLLELRYTLTTNSVEPFQVVPKMDNGTMLNVLKISLVRKLESWQLKTNT